MIRPSQRRRPPHPSLKRTRPTMVAAHPYQGDGVTDHAGRDRCLGCGLPVTHPCHDLPTTPEAVRADEARRIGETDG